MDRFEWTNAAFLPGESLVVQQEGVKVYDGDSPTLFERGNLLLTTHRIIWFDSIKQGTASRIALKLSQIIFTEEQSSGLGKSAKIVIHLHPALPGKPQGPVTHSSNTYVRLSFKEGGQVEFNRCLREELAHRRWEHAPPEPVHRQTKPREIRAGIIGIERKLEEKRKETDKNISKAFEDLNVLMVKAKEMVDLSKTIANKIKEKHGDISEDETIKFKSYLLSLGIDNPVTRDTHGTGLKYHLELAKQLIQMLETPIKENGGMMALTDIYCRVNRARGMELLSPDDLLAACRQFAGLKAPLRLRIFDSGVQLVELVSHGEEQAIKHVVEILEQKESLTADELSHTLGISVLLSKGRLLSAEQMSLVCRDESVEGVRFYPNWFLTGPR